MTHDELCPLFGWQNRATIHPELCACPTIRATRRQVIEALVKARDAYVASVAGSVDGRSSGAVFYNDAIRIAGGD